MWPMADLYVHICGLLQTYRCIYVSYYIPICAYMWPISDLYVHINNIYVTYRYMYVAYMSLLPAKADVSIRQRCLFTGEIPT